MKYRTRSIIYSLLAGLTILINSCRQKEPALQLLATKQLTQFPSASAIEYHDGKLFLFGDDAAYLLIMDTGYRQVDTIHYLADTVQRIPKYRKPDVEAATMVFFNGRHYLYAIGSFSAEQRKKFYTFPLAAPESFTTGSNSFVLQSLQSLPESNIEGIAVVQSKLILANRANKTHATNILLIMDDVVLQHQASSQIHMIDLALEKKHVIGVSGLYYLAEKDLMLFTASEEDTPSATQDGIIGNSYLGWIKNFSKKLKARAVQPDQLIDLSTISNDLKKQKVEAVCAEVVKNDETILHLAADNDNGKSRLFKLKLRFNKDRKFLF